VNQVGPLWSLLSLVILVAMACAPESDLDESIATPVTPAAAMSVPTSPHPTLASQNSSQEDGVWRPSPGTNWQWQLTGDIDTSFEVQMYDIDLFDAPQEVIEQLHADGRVVICYLSAGSWEDWRSDANQFTDAAKGEDNGWPGEKWLDIRKLDVLGPIMESRLDLAVQKGCDGVEPDNVGGYNSDTGFLLTYQDQLEYNIWLSEAAHRRHLSIGLKNGPDQIGDLLPYFDWALNEECFQYDECEPFLAFVEAGKAVFGVEYTGDPQDFCLWANAMNFDWLKKGLELDASRVACR
jgi:hypothetical protein